MANEYLARKNKVLTFKKQVSAGTFNQPSSATDSVLIEDAEVTDNWQTLKSNEASGSIDAGETEVTHALPAITGSFKLRGSGDVTQAPRGAAILESGGFDITTNGGSKAVLPATGTFTAAAGTTSSFTVDRGAGNGAQLPSTAVGCALLVGRVVELTTNPATLRRAVIKKCTIAGAIVTFEIADVLGAALDNTTTVKILPCWIADLSLAPADIPVGSAELFEDGSVDRFKDCRTALEFSVEHGAHVIVKATIEGLLHNWGNAAVPTDMNFDGVPSPAKWRKGRARFGTRKVACTSLSTSLNTKQTRHGDPEEDQGIDAPYTTERDVNGKLQINKVKPGTFDLRAAIAANTKEALVAALDIDGAAGTRWVIIQPNAKMTGRASADAEGIDDENLDIQGVRVSPLPALRLVMV